MMKSQRDKNLLDFPRAFEVDRSWYQSYWYDAPQPEPVSSSVRVVVWAAVLVIGMFVGF